MDVKIHKEYQPSIVPNDFIITIRDLINAVDDSYGLDHNRTPILLSEAQIRYNKCKNNGFDVPEPLLWLFNQREMIQKWITYLDYFKKINDPNFTKLFIGDRELEHIIKMGIVNEDQLSDIEKARLPKNLPFPYYMQYMINNFPPDYGDKLNSLDRSNIQQQWEDISYKCQNSKYLFQSICDDLLKLQFQKVKSLKIKKRARRYSRKTSNNVIKMQSN